MLEVAGLTVEKVFMLLMFIAAGYILRKSGKLPDNAGKVLSALSATIFCPAYNIRNLWNNFTVAKIGENALVMGYGLLFTLIAIGVALVLARLLGKPGMERRSLSYAFAIPNYGYFGYPVIEGVFGTEFLSQVLVFIVPLSIATNTYGYLLFTPNGKISWKRIFNPLTVGVLIGMVLGLSDALVELTGSLAGFSFALREPKLVALSGLIVGISATFSMASSEFLSAKSEGRTDALKSCAYTGVAYLVTVAALILPYLIFGHWLHALLCMLGIIVVIIAAFTYYTAVAQDQPFFSRFLEMALISISVAVISFVVGILAKMFLGVDV